MAKVVFYCNDTKANIQAFEYYQQDIEALTSLGHDVVVCNRYRDLPLHFDVMFVWWWTYALVPVLWAMLHNKPSLITGTFNFRFPDTYKGIDYGRRPFWQRALISAATQLCSLNLFVDQREVESCAAHFGLNNARHYPHVLHADYLRGPSSTRELCVFNLAWRGKHNLIRKGVPDLLKAVALLKEQGLLVRVKLAGLEGDGTGFLNETIASLGIASQVECLGSVNRAHKIDLLRSCEIYVQPSYYEGFGLGTAEAMGSGACIITCDVGAVRSVVGDCGAYVPSASPDKLADAIRNLMEDAAERRRLQSAALARARGEFSFQSKLERLRGYLAELSIK